MRIHAKKIITISAVLAILIFTYWWGGNSSQLHGWSTDTASDNPGDIAVFDDIHEDIVPTEDKRDNINVVCMQPDISDGELDEGKTDEKKVEEKKTNFSAESNTLLSQSEETVVSDKEFTCTLSIRCDSLLSSMKYLGEEKIELVPKDGVIYAEKSVTAYEGESVFNLLVRETKLNKIHLEFENTPIYNSAYIEGIGNLYEFDCGELSGWMYKVNGWFPNYGCSRYLLKPGDRVEWVYTCDLGKDVGGDYSSRNGL